jgi:hypothetical protein
MQLDADADAMMPSRSMRSRRSPLRLWWQGDSQGRIMQTQKYCIEILTLKYLQNYYAYLIAKMGS